MLGYVAHIPDLRRGRVGAHVAAGCPDQRRCSLPSCRDGEQGTEAHGDSDAFDHCDLSLHGHRGHGLLRTGHHEAERALKLASNLATKSQRNLRRSVSLHAAGRASAPSLRWSAAWSCLQRESAADLQGGGRGFESLSAHESPVQRSGRLVPGWGMRRHTKISPAMARGRSSRLSSCRLGDGLTGSGDKGVDRRRVRRDRPRPFQRWS